LPSPFVITAFNPMVPLATVVGPRIEVPVMRVLVWLARAARQRLFGEPMVPREMSATAAS